MAMTIVGRGRANKPACMDVIPSDLELVSVGSTSPMRKRTVPAAGLQEVGGLNR
jgi:hypothetical protein